MERPIRRCLPIPQKLYKVTSRRLKTKEERRCRTVFSGLYGLYRLHCRTTPLLPRPKNNRKKRKLYYSGKKKKHTSVKNPYTTNQKICLIVYKSRHKQMGRKHDYRIYKDNHPKLSGDIMSVYDLGFQGVEKDYPTEQPSSIPIKKEKGCELTVQQKKSTIAIILQQKEDCDREHAFARLKKYRIIDNDTFRNRLKRRYDRISDIVSGLINYRIMNAC